MLKEEVEESDEEEDEEEGAVDEDEEEDFADLTKLCLRRSSRIAQVGQ